MMEVAAYRETSDLQNIGSIENFLRPEQPSDAHAVPGQAAILAIPSLG